MSCFCTIPALRRTDLILDSTTGYQDFLTLWKDADSDIPILIASLPNPNPEDYFVGVSLTPPPEQAS